MEAQVLQVRDEVRNCALVYALALTQDVKLVGKHRIHKVMYIVSDTLTLGIIYEQQTKQQAWLSTAGLLVIRTE